MAARILTLSALLALAQAKAIVTNHCHYDIFLWSVPQTGSTYTNALPLKSAGRYEEPWRYGTQVNPGIAIKISPNENGIMEQKDEINFAYSIDASNSSKVWINLSNVRGKAFNNNNLAFHTCHGSYQTSDVSTRQCHATDDIELVLCDTARTTPLKDTTSLDKIIDCYNKPDQDHPKPSCNKPACNNKPENSPPKPDFHCGKKPEHSPCTKKPSDGHLKCPRDCGAQPYSMCNAKITYPRRLSYLKDRNSTEASASQPNTVPLSTVMQYEAAKHSGTKPICDWVAEHDEKIEDCDEAKMERWAKHVYKHLCDEDVFPDLPADCEVIKKELKKVYPGVDKTASL